MKINVLDPTVYNQIAAGEVVENPASVVKELVENSLDAGATSISIYLEGGGLQRIEVSDNGVGIAPQELKKAILPHATSKLAEAADLETISTLGFRGEALASIASVSELTIKSHVEDENDAYRLDCRFGVADEEPRLCSYARGTTVIVAKLFANVPARLKFLKSQKLEEGQITRLVGQFIMANPSVHFELINGNTTLFQTQGDTLLDAIRTVYGEEVAAKMLPIEQEDGNGMRVTGYISEKSLTKPNRNFQTFILNGRIISDSTLSSVVQNAYEGRLMLRNFPVVVIHLVVPFGDVDVNVHPNKREVRFRNARKLQGLVYHAAKDALQAADEAALDALLTDQAKYGIRYDAPKPSDIISPMTSNAHSLEAELEDDDILESRPFDFAKFELTPEEAAYMQQFFPDGRHMYDPNNEFQLPESIFRRGLIRQEPISDPDEMPQKPVLLADIEGWKGKKPPKDTAFHPERIVEHPLEGSLFAPFQSMPEIKVDIEYRPPRRTIFQTENMRIIGQLFATYVMIETPKALLLIDQHAAHERLYYEKFMQDYREKRVDKQPLLVPYIHECEDEESFQRIAQMRSNLDELGFEIVVVPPRRIIELSTVPAEMPDLKIKDFFDELQDPSEPVHFGVPVIVRERIMKASCRAAIKAGEVLNERQIETLLEMFISQKTPPCCPHGRPIFLEITKAELEKMFGRRV